MVRVIPVHNFCEQNVSQIEEPTAACVVNSPSNREFLLLALASHSVEVYELSSPDLKLFTTFPTVDLVESILHCSRGNYVATLESKSSRDNVHTNNFVRIYINWEKHDHRNAMRARIAGRVTPSLSRPMNGLEMIEFPLNSQPTAIACCQKTGNLLVASGSTAILHEFKMETQQPFKQKFIDFEARPWSLGFHFVPTQMEIVEDFISVMDSLHFVVFRLTNPFYEDLNCLGSVSSNNSSSNDKTTISTDLLRSNDFDSLASVESNLRSNNRNYKLKLKSTDQQVFFPHSDYHHSIKDISTKNSIDRNSNIYSCKSQTNKSDYINWDCLIQDGEKEAKNLLDSGVIESDCLPVTVSLPSIHLKCIGPHFTASPFELNSADTQVFIKTTSPENGWSENYVIKNILRLKIATSREPVYNTNHGTFDYFTCSSLKPLYLKINPSSCCIKRSMLHSDEYKYLNGVSCLVCTVQEGFLYHFSTELNHSEPICLTCYPFTAPVSHIVLENTVLHALTEAGLESYTLRLPNFLSKTLHHVYDTSLIYPDISEPVCLIGLRPFLGIQQLFNSKNYVVLLAKADEAWTLYSLKLPDIEEIYFDVLNAAKSYKVSSPLTYRHLLEEACSMLWLAKNTVDYKPCNTESNSVQDRNVGKLQVLYHQSCALLGDYYIRSESQIHWYLCVQFYKMSGLRPDEVLSRKSVYNAPGLLTYVTQILLNINNGPEADALFQGQNIVDIITMENKQDLLKLILNSNVLREYATEKLIKHLSSKERDDLTRLVLTLLYIHADKLDNAEKMIEPVSKSLLRHTILNQPQLLFEETIINVKRPVLLSFSEFAGILMRRKTAIFAEILATLIQHGHANLHQVIQAFMEYLPSRVGRDGHDDASALQLFIEVYLQHYFQSISDKDMTTMKNEISHDYIIIQVLKILVRSYLGKLVQIGIYKMDEERDFGDNYLFANLRPKYLDKIPPCCKDFQKILNSDNAMDLSKVESEPVIRPEVLKLQALLASEILPQECLEEIERFLETEHVIGSLAFKTLILSDCQIVTQILIEKCPQAVLSYAKTKYIEDFQWEFLIELLKNELSKAAKPEIKVFFEHTLTETLKHAAVTIPFKYLNKVFPKDDKGFPSQHYMEVCAQTVRAEDVKLLIKDMCQQLLTNTVRA